MVEQIIGLLFLVFIVITCFFFFLGALVIWAMTVLFDSKLRILHYYSCFWASVYVWIMPAWRVKHEGKEHIKKKTYVVVSNHQSLLDILVIFGLFFPFKWVSKAEIFRLPFIGWNMKLNKYVGVKRGDRGSIGEMMKESEAHLLQGSSVYFFPEGTRSIDGSLKSFKSGAFTLAKKLQVPILPIVITGTTNALPKHSLKFHGRHDILIKVLPEISPEKYSEMNEYELTQHTHALIGDHIPSR
ncbi:MAG: 1-acyl-sn-glycerol-3-phosphate acyltransferase [Pseudomonadales bacterium]|nr:1-acyl-sn-glycerol-3-phosphate acyltransferase [Pseudomonadales bacterium]